jgi:hypothetical protein
MKCFLFALVMLVGCASVQGQPFSVSAKDAPELRGLRLGMTVEQVRSRYKFIDHSEDETGFSKTRLPRLFLPEPEQEGVRELELGFLDGKLVYIIVAYDDKTTWPSAEQFALAISKSLNLPRAWEKKSTPSELSQQVAFQLRCDGITFGASIASVNTPLLALFRNDTKAIRETRRARVEEGSAASSNHSMHSGK